MNAPLHVVFAANRAYVPYVSAAITSVRHNLAPAVALDVTILSQDLSPTEIGWPNRGVADSLRCFSPDLDRSTLPIRPTDHLTVETYYRLFLEMAFDETVKRVVYLDADLVVLGDLSQLAAVDLGGKTIGAVVDIYVRRWGKGGGALRGETTDDNPSGAAAGARFSRQQPGSDPFLGSGCPQCRPRRQLEGTRSALEPNDALLGTAARRHAPVFPGDHRQFA